MQKAYWTRIVSRGQPSRATKLLISNRSKQLLWLPAQTFPSCGRKRGLFGHDVAKSREAWQTMELYRARISEVHQTPPSHGKPIWAYRECLGHPKIKKNKAKRWFFGWVIHKLVWSSQKKSSEVNQVKWSEVNWIEFEVDWIEENWSGLKWSEVKWIEVDWSEVKWTEVNLKWSELKWSEVKWIEVKWIEVKWIEVKWIEVKWIESEVNWIEVKWIELDWIWSGLNWSEVEWIVNYLP